MNNNNNKHPKVLYDLVSKGYKVSDTIGKIYFLDCDSIPSSDEGIYGPQIINGIDNRSIIDTIEKDMGTPPIFINIIPDKTGIINVNFGFEIIGPIYETLIISNVKVTDNDENVSEKLTKEHPMMDVLLYALIKNSIEAYRKNETYCLENNLYDGLSFETPHIDDYNFILDKIVEAVDKYVNGHPFIGDGRITCEKVNAEIINEWCRPLIGLKIKNWDFVTEFKEFLIEFFNKVAALNAAA